MRRTGRAGTARLLVTVTFVGLLVALSGCGGTDQAPAPVAVSSAAQDAVVDRYLASLEDRDSQAMAALVNPRLDARSDIDRLMREYGGQRFRDTRRTYRQEFGTEYVVVDIDSHLGDGRVFHQSLSLLFDRGHWWIGIGRSTAPNTPPSASTESPTAR
jgi:hypothetical protein